MRRLRLIAGGGDLPQAVALRIDPDDLTEALGALLENAARHARSRVWVGMRADDDRTAVIIRDDGTVKVWRGVRYAAPPSVAGLTFVGWGEPIGCGGVAVFPNDVVVADQDGAVLIPQAFLDHVLAEGPEQERMEAWIVNEVNNGAQLPGLYPMNAETKARYAATKK